MQQSDRPAPTDVPQVTPVVRKPSTLLRPELLIEARRYLMMRQIVFGGLLLLLLLHLAAPGVFDLATILVLIALYLLTVGSGGLEAARLSGTGDRRQERLADDALRRAGRLQSLLEPSSATDEVFARLTGGGANPALIVIKSGNEVEDALRAVYRHYAEAERVAGSTNGADLPLTFLVQELIWRALLEPNIYDTAEPILSLREMALTPRTQIQGQTALDAARAAQSVVVRIQSLGIEIHPRRQPLAWLRAEPAADPDPPALLSAPEPEIVEMDDHPEPEPAQLHTLGPRAARPEPRGIEVGATPDTERLDGLAGTDGLHGADELVAKEPVARDAARREARPRAGAEPSDISAPS